MQPKQVRLVQPKIEIKIGAITNEEKNVFALMLEYQLIMKIKKHHLNHNMRNTTISLITI